MRIHLGSGLNILAGWINTDIFSQSDEVTLLDFTKPFPYSNDSCEAVFCEHAIEHVSKEDARVLCAEAYRVLKPGGHFRVVTPSLENMAKLISSPNSKNSKKYTKFFRKFSENESASLGDAFNAMFYWHGHRYIYSKTDISNVLKDVGFDKIAFFQSGKYGADVFVGADCHGKWIGEDINRIESMAAEATKSQSPRITGR